MADAWFTSRHTLSIGAHVCVGNPLHAWTAVCMHAHIITHVSAHTLMDRRKVLSTFGHTSQIEEAIQEKEREDYEAEREMKPRGSALSALTGV